MQPIIENKLNKHINPLLDPLMSTFYRDVLLAGMSGACLGAFLPLAYPFEHMGNHQRFYSYKDTSVLQVLRHQNKYLLRGITVAWGRSIVSNAVPFAVIEATKSQEQADLKALFISAVLNIILTAPFDTVLSRMQDKKYHPETALAATKAIAKQGFYEFYRGTGLTLFAKGLKQALPIVATNTLRKYYEEDKQPETGCSKMSR